MAKNTDITSLPIEIRLSRKQMEYLSALMPEDQQAEVNRVRDAIATVVEHQANGGMMLTPDTLKKILDSTGVDPACGDDLLPYLAAGSGRIEGCLNVAIKIDPAYEPALQEIATLRGCEIQNIVNDTVSACFDNAWYEHLPIQPEHVLMTPADRGVLEDLLGAKFASGTALAALIRKAMGADSLFSEPEPEPVGAGV